MDCTVAIPSPTKQLLEAIAGKNRWTLRVAVDEAIRNFAKQQGISTDSTQPSPRRPTRQHRQTTAIAA